MNEPEITIKENSDNIRKKKTSPVFKVVLILLAIIIVATGAGIVYLKVVYNQAYLKSLCETEISTAVGGKCTVDSIDWSLFGSVEAGGISLSIDDPGKLEDSRYLEVDSVKAQVHLWQSLISFQPVLALDVDGVKVQIERILSKDSESPNGQIGVSEQKTALIGDADDLALDNADNNAEKFSTNINKVIASVAQMPWKEMVADFNWKIADVNAKISNVEVVVKDKSNELKEISFGLNTVARLQKSGLNLDLNITQDTPDVKDGGITLAAGIVFDWDEASRRKDKPLAFIGSTEIKLLIRDIDLGYIGKYYIQSEQQVLRPSKPLSGSLNIKAADLSSVKLNVDLSSDRLLEFYKDGALISDDGPSFSLTVEAETDLSQEWSTIKNGSIVVSGSDSKSNIKWFQFNTQVFGSFADEIVTSIQSDINVGAVSKSVVGRAFDFYNIAMGDILFGSELTWKKNANWGYDFNFRSRDLVIKNNGSAVPAPITMLISGDVEASDGYTPELITAQAKCSAPGISINTSGNNGIVIPLDANRLSLKGEADAVINMPEFFQAFDTPLSRLGLKSIDEVFNIRFKVDSESSARVVVEMKNTRNQYAPCVINVNYLPKADNGFTADFSLIAEKKAVQFKAAVEAAKGQNDVTDLVFNNQFAFRVGAGINLLKRIQNVVPGLSVAQYPVAGVMRGSINGRGVMSDTQFSLAANNSILIEDMVFTTDSGRKFTDKKTSITGSFSIKDVLGQRILSVKSFDVKGDTAEIDLKVERLGVAELSENLLAGLNNIKDLDVMIKLGRRTFENLYALLGDAALPVIKTGKDLTLQVKSNDNGGIDVNKVELNSTGLSLSVNELVLNPERILDAVNSNDFGRVAQSLSPFNIKVKTGSTFWKGLKLEPGLEFSGNADLDLAYDPALDRLTLSRLVIAGDNDNRAFITRASAGTVIDNLSKIIGSPTLPLILDSLPNGVSVPVVTVSLPMLKRFIENNGGQLNIRGRDIELSNLRVVKAKDANTLQAAGAISSTGVGIDELLVYKGKTNFNNLIKLEDNNYSITGEMIFDNAEMQLKAPPYLYNKVKNQKVKLYYKAAGNDSGAVNVYRAGISGGALQFDMSNMKYTPKADGKFAFSLPSFKVLAPFELTAGDIEINPDTDRVTARLATKQISLSDMSSSLDTGLPCRLGGYIGALNLQVNDRFSTLTGQGQQRLSPDNRLSVEPSSISLDSTTAQNVSMNIGVGKILGDTANGKVIVGGLTLTSPSGYSDPTPIRVGKIESTLNLDTLTSGRKIIDEVIISSFKAVYEMKVGGNSISQLQKNIDVLLPSSTGSGDNTGRPSQSSAERGVSEEPAQSGGGVLIRNLYLNNGVVDIKSKLINTSVKLPQTHVKDIGGDNPRVAFTTVMSVLLKSIGKAAVSILDDSAGTAVKSVTNLLSGALSDKDKTGEDGDDSDNNPAKAAGKLIDSVLKLGSDDGNESDGDNSNPLGNLFK